MVYQIALVYSTAQQCTTLCFLAINIVNCHTHTPRWFLDVLQYSALLHWQGLNYFPVFID